MAKKITVNALLASLGFLAFYMVFLSVPSTPTTPLLAAENVRNATREVSQPDAARPKSAESASVGQSLKGAFYAARAAAKFKLGSFRPNAQIEVPVRGDLSVQVIDESTICLKGSYRNFLEERFETECGDFLKGIDSPVANLPTWSRNVFYNIMGAEIILKYRPHIAAKWREYSSYRIAEKPYIGANSGIMATPAAPKTSGSENGNAEVAELEIAEGGYWINPFGQAKFLDMRSRQMRLTRNANVAHFAYLKLSKPLKNGARYTLQTPLGQSADFFFDDSKTVSGAIKTNRVGYSPSAGRKYAYVGAWLGDMGALNLSHLEGEKFFVVDSNSGAKLFEGRLRHRPDAFYKDSVPFSGEYVLEADFSDFSLGGNFRIYVPRVGVSHEFSIDNSAMGEAFYVHMKGLYHKRCGIAKEKPYTNWTMGACHMKTYRSSFPPNNLHYANAPKNKDAGFFDKDGRRMEISHFKLIESLGLEAEAVNVCGGWHDAADYDRRPYHFDVVNDLLSAYLFKPENFSDNQLNIPESGDGVADILNEAIWGMEVWLKAQSPDGSVGTWIETTSHPTDYNPSTDTQPYCLSAATRESTMQYAGCASMLALALKTAGQAELSRKYSESARRAYDFASNPDNRFVKAYSYPKEKKEGGRKTVEYVPVTYRESAEVPAQFVFKAAFNLWILSSKDEYLSACKNVEKNMDRCFAETSWRINPLLFSEFCAYGKNCAALAALFKTYSARMLKYADERLLWLNTAYPYRIPWYPASHSYVTHMSWGKSHPLNLAKFFMTAHALTADKKYRDAAYLCNDWHCGANPTGGSMTSGLGKNYPVAFLDLPSYSDGIEEYVLGITPYRNTFGISRDCIKLAECLFYEPRKDRKFSPRPVMLLDDKVMRGASTVDEAAKAVSAAWPIFRRFANVEAFSVAASEFTVSETIAPSAALTGWLLEPNWKPSERLKNIQPASDITKLEGFLALP